MSDELPRIEHTYLLFSHIPHYRHPDGSIWLEQLWHHDLAEHLPYLADFVLVSPMHAWSPDANLVRLDPPKDTSFDVIAIPDSNSVGEAIRILPRLVWILWRTIGRAEIVHSGIVGWPVPLGWIVNPIALLRGKKLLIVVESAFWRIPDGQPAGWVRRLRASISESLARFFVNRAHLCLFEHQGYRDSLLTAGRGKSFITPGIWVNEDDMISRAEASKHWSEKAKTKPLRVLFAGRLIPDKGVAVLLEALALLEADEVAMQVDIIGEGPMRSTSESAVAKLHHVESQVLDTVPYGAEFFALLRQYHAIVVPSLSDEQPRIIFDAYSQALPVLASATDGLASNVVEGETGRLFAPGDPEALSRLLAELANDPSSLGPLALRAREAAEGFTHRAMHLERWRILYDCFGAR